MARWWIASAIAAAVLGAAVGGIGRGGAGAALIALAACAWYRPIVGLAALLPALALDRMVAPPGVWGGHVRTDELAVWVFLSVVAIRYGRSSFDILKWGAPLLLWVALSNLVNLPLHQALAYSLRYTVFIWCVWAAQRVTAGSRVLAPLRVSILVMVAQATVLATWQTAALGQDRVRGLFNTPNLHAGHLALVAPVCIALAWRANTPGARWLWGGAGTVLGAVTLLTISRGGYVAFVVGVAAVLAAGWAGQRRSRRRAVVAIAGVLVILALAVTGAALSAWRSSPVMLLEGEGMARLAPVVAVRHFLDLRLPTWRVGLTMIDDRPWLGFGGPTRYGPESGQYATRFEELSPRLRDYPKEVPRRTWRSHLHQGVLQVAAQWGVPAAMAVVFLCGGLFSGLHRRAVGDVWALGAFGALAALVAHNLVDYTVGALAAEAGLLVGIGLGASAPAQGNHIEQAHREDSQVEP